MRKEVETIKRSHAVQKKIKEKQKELLDIQKECKHEVLIDFIDYQKSSHYRKCLFCGEIVDNNEAYEYMFQGRSYKTALDLSYEGIYWLLQQLFIQVAKANRKMKIDDICKKIEESSNKKDFDFYQLQIKAFWGRHD